MVDETENLSHAKWQRKCHMVFIPRCGRETLYKQLKRYLWEVLRGQVERKESRIEEEHLMPLHRRS